MVLTTADILWSAVRQNQLPYRADGARPAALRKQAMQDFGFDRVREPEKLLRLYARLMLQLGVTVGEIREWHSSGLFWNNVRSIVEGRLIADDRDRRWYQENEQTLNTKFLDRNHTLSSATVGSVQPTPAKRPSDEHSGFIKRRRIVEPAELINHAKSCADIYGFDPEIAYGSRSDVGQRRAALTSAHFLLKAVNRDQRPRDGQTRKDYGFDVAKNWKGLVGVYQRLFWSGITESKLDQWRIDGVLRRKIEQKIRDPNWGGVCPYGSDWCCQWFLDHPLVLPFTKSPGLSKGLQLHPEENSNGTASISTTRSTTAVEPPAEAGAAGEAAAAVAEADTNHPKLKSLEDGKAAINVNVYEYELGPCNESFAVSEPEDEGLEVVRQDATSDFQEMCGIVPAAITTENSIMTSEMSGEVEEGQCDSDMQSATGSKTRNVAVAGASRHRTGTSALESNFAPDIPTSKKDEVVQVRALPAPVDALTGDINGHAIIKPVSQLQDRAIHNGVGEGLEATENPQETAASTVEAFAENTLATSDEPKEDRIRADDEEMAVEFAMMEVELTLTARPEWTANFWL